MSAVNPRSIREGDIVLVNKKGRRFHAAILGREGPEYKLLPITSGITWMRCIAREIEDHWINRRRFAK